MSQQSLIKASLPANRLLAEFSLWSADLVRIADDISRVDSYVDIYHADASDGHFSPALLLFPDFIAQIRPLTQKPVHVHLMVDDRILLQQIDQFASVGADIISIHAENSRLKEGLARINALGCAAGIVLQLHSEVIEVAPFLEQIAILTLLGTKMGIKGVGLDLQAEYRMKQARKMIDEFALGSSILLAADGGIREQTVPMLRRCGADTIVMGSLAFGADDLASQMRWVHRLAGPNA